MLKLSRKWQQIMFKTQRVLLRGSHLPIIPLPFPWVIMQTALEVKQQNNAEHKTRLESQVNSFVFLGASTLHHSMSDFWPSHSIILSSTSYAGHTNQHPTCTNKRKVEHSLTHRLTQTTSYLWRVRDALNIYRWNSASRAVEYRMTIQQSAAEYNQHPFASPGTVCVYIS